MRFILFISFHMLWNWHLIYSLVIRRPLNVNLFYIYNLWRINEKCFDLCVLHMWTVLWRTAACNNVSVCIENLVEVNKIYFVCVHTHKLDNMSFWLFLLVLYTFFPDERLVPNMSNLYTKCTLSTQAKFSIQTLTYLIMNPLHTLFLSFIFPTFETSGLSVFWFKLNFWKKLPVNNSFIFFLLSSFHLFVVVFCLVVPNKQECYSPFQ